ncbi:hypothetical protein [Singulisphaera acidiphila]|uniref:hypothetical protein n=1 Tax=Singulisphaera acidiphila TaxID=466153 RepID=UPI0002D661FD|nr:hypothetical protein [Singulisphaera acidiphila]
MSTGTSISLNLSIWGTFFSLCSLLDGNSRFLIHGEIRKGITERGVETIVQRVPVNTTAAPGP